MKSPVSILVALSFVFLSPHSVNALAADDETPQKELDLKAGVGANSAGAAYSLDASGRVLDAKYVDKTDWGTPTGFIATSEVGASGHLTLGENGIQSVGVKGMDSMMFGVGVEDPGTFAIYGLQGRILYDSNSLTGIKKAGPEVGSIMATFLSIGGGKSKSYVGLSAPAALFIPTAVSAGRLGSAAPWGANLEWDFAGFARIQTKVGEINFRAGFTAGVTTTSAPGDHGGGAYSKIYGEAGIKNIGDSPVQVQLTATQTNTSPSGEPSQSIKEGFLKGGVVF